MKNYRVLILSACLCSSVSFAEVPSVLPKKPVQSSAPSASERPMTAKTPTAQAVVSKPEPAQALAKKKALPAQQALKSPPKKPIQPKVKHYSIGITGGGLTNYSQLGAQFEYRWSNFGLGLYYGNSSIRNFDDSFSVTGAEYGVMGFYHFLPASYTQRNQYAFDPGAYVVVGQGTFKSEAQPNLPAYIMTEAGLDTSFNILPNVGISGYLKMGIHYMYHSSVGSQYMGSSTSVGVKWAF